MSKNKKRASVVSMRYSTIDKAQSILRTGLVWGVWGMLVIYGLVMALCTLITLLR